MPKYLLLTLFLVSFSFAFGQDKGGIWGHVSDSELDDEPLLFAQVELKGSSRSIQTNFHGNFELNNLEPGDHTLVIQYLGYENIEIPVVVDKDQITRLEFSMGRHKFIPEDYKTSNGAMTSARATVSAGQN